MTLEQYLVKHKVSGAAFAAMLGISEASVTRIRRGEQNISRDLMQRIIIASGGKVKAQDLIFPHGKTAGGQAA